MLKYMGEIMDKFLFWQLYIKFYQFETKIILDDGPDWPITNSATVNISNSDILKISDIR